MPVYDDVQAGKAYYFVQLVSALVDVAPLGLKSPDFITHILYALGYDFSQSGHRRFGHVRLNDLTYKKDFLRCHILAFCNAKLRKKRE